MKIKYIGSKRAITVPLPLGVKSRKETVGKLRFVAGQEREVDETEADVLLKTNQFRIALTDLSPQELRDLRDGAPHIWYSGDRTYAIKQLNFMAAGAVSRPKIEQPAEPVTASVSDDAKSEAAPEKKRRGRPPKAK